MSRNILIVDSKTLTESEIAAALEKCDGNLSEAAEHLGIKRHVLAKHVQHVEALRLYHLDFLEKAIDKAQSNVFKAVESGDYGASQFLLTTLGKDRGFSTKQEMTLVKSVDLTELSDEELDSRIDELAEALIAEREARKQIAGSANQPTALCSSASANPLDAVPHEERVKRDPGYRSEAERRAVMKAVKE